MSGISRIKESQNFCLTPFQPRKSKFLYVITWPVIKIHDIFDGQWLRIKIVAEYSFLIAWLVYLIVALIRNFLSTLPIFIFTIVALLYT